MTIKAEIIAIGTELLIGHVINTNAAYLSEELNTLGISTYFHSTVGDNPSRIKEILDLAVKRSDLVICTGGLGPTSDDITHEVIAEFCKLKLIEIPELKSALIDKFKKAKRDMPAINLKQALVPEGSRLIPNPRGTATGIILQHHNSTIMTFPGVPSEMRGMFQNHAKSFLREEFRQDLKAGVILSRKIKFFNIGESQMAEMLGEDIFRQANPSVAPYASLGECYVRITAKAASEEEAQSLIKDTESFIVSKMGKFIYGYDEESIPKLLSKILSERSLSLAFAESCTGGLLAKTLTDEAGASKYFKTGLVSYANSTKEKLLKVKPETLSKHGAVSAETAREMALGLSKISDSDINLSITGIAGPDGASLDKPIGTIFISMNYIQNGEIKKEETLALDWSFRELSREQVREIAMLKTFFILRNFIESLNQAS